MTGRKRTLFTVVVLAVLAFSVGAAVAHEGYGVGDGTGPVLVDARDGTGEQHQTPATTVAEVVTTVPTSSTPAGDQDQDQDRVRDQDRDQLCTLEPDQLQDRDRDRDRDRVHVPTTSQVPTPSGTPEQVGDAEREQVRAREQAQLHDGQCTLCEQEQVRNREREHEQEQRGR